MASWKFRSTIEDEIFEQLPTAVQAALVALMDAVALAPRNFLREPEDEHDAPLTWLPFDNGAGMVVVQEDPHDDDVLVVDILWAGE